MRIAFVGKGGSGKTTLSSAFALYSKEFFNEVLALDADINQHLESTLFGIERQKPSLSEAIMYLKEYIKGNNSLITDISEMLKTTPPGKGSQKLLLKGQHSFWDKYVSFSRGIKLINAGEITEDDIGTKCYHAKTGSIELLLNHLKDERDECIIIDMTAGADAFSSGLFTKFDMTCVIVEPTFKSLSVFHQYKKYCTEFNVCLYAVGNKILNEDDILFLKSQLGPDLLAVFYMEQKVRENERGELYEVMELDVKNQQTLSSIIHALKEQKRDWDHYQQQTYFFHKKNALSWGNASVGKDLSLQIDPGFSYKDW
ncbi:MAG: ATP-binding protein [Candidatus Gracilibacteria bacterium]